MRPGSPEQLLAGYGPIWCAPSLGPTALPGPTGLQTRDGLPSPANTQPALSSDGLVAAALRGGAPRSVCLTFDDGPNPLVTPLILRILAKAGVKATFFLVGTRCQEYPRLVAQIAAEGHEIGNHTFSHRPGTSLSPGELLAEVRATDDLICDLTGRHTRRFRPPGGRAQPDALRAIDAAGYTTVLWSENTGDWREMSPERIAARALHDVRPGSVILLHNARLRTARALPTILAGLERRGLKAGTVSQCDIDRRVVRRRPQELLRLMRRSEI
jgi:peptidoglycan/xylan/chitin deacetylase (PgdA/CDA1 family)